MSCQHGNWPPCEYCDEIETNLAEAASQIEKLTQEVEGLRAERVLVIENQAYWKERAERLEDTARDLTDAKASGSMSGVWRMLAVSHELDCMKARAERLAEALRNAADDLDRGVSRCDVAAHMRAHAALERENDDEG